MRGFWRFWGIVLKLNEDNKPRLMASIKSEKNSLAVINLQTDKIEVFLEDLIGEFAKEA